MGEGLEGRAGSGLPTSGDGIAGMIEVVFASRQSPTCIVAAPLAPIPDSSWIWLLVPQLSPNSTCRAVSAILTSFQHSLSVPLF